MKLKNIFVLLPIFLVLTSGIYRHDQPIEKYLKLANHDEFRIVGQVLSFDQKNWVLKGSCVLIDSVTILSAAHCFVGATKKDTIVTYLGQKVKTHVQRGKQIRNETEFRFNVMNIPLIAQKIVIHPNYLVDGTCDLAVIKLMQPVKGIRPLKINTLFDELNDTVTGVGFGTSGPANAPQYVNSYQIKLAGQNIIDSIGGTEVSGQKSVLFADFDAPDIRQGCNKIGDANPLELEYSIGAGDSGGPLFRKQQNILILVGIATYAPRTITNLLKNGYYCELNGWTRLSAFIDWINGIR